MLYFFRCNKILILTLLISFMNASLFAYTCPYVCYTNPLQEIYPNQNMCVLLNSIPPVLQGKSYIVYPNCIEYDMYRFGFNKRFNFFPAAIIVPTDEADLLEAFTALIQNKLPFSVRSGGHCYGPGSLSNGYIIDLSNFDIIVPDIANNQVSIGAGARLGDVISTLGALGYAIPTGTCPSVGVCGLALGGGIGYLARQFGLTCDSIVNITLLNAQGEIIVVDANSFPIYFGPCVGRVLMPLV